MSHWSRYWSIITRHTIERSGGQQQQREIGTRHSHRQYRRSTFHAKQWPHNLMQDVLLLSIPFHYIAENKSFLLHAQRERAGDGTIYSRMNSYFSWIISQFIRFFFLVARFEFMSYAVCLISSLFFYSVFCFWFFVRCQKIMKRKLCNARFFISPDFRWMKFFVDFRLLLYFLSTCAFAKLRMVPITLCSTICRNFWRTAQPKSWMGRNDWFIF